MNIRYNIAFRKYSLSDRISLWFRNVCQAIKQTPPDNYAVYIPVNPGEPGYDGAWLEMGVDEYPLRFERSVPDK